MLKQHQPILLLSMYHNLKITQHSPKHIPDTERVVALQLHDLLVLGQVTTTRQLTSQFLKNIRYHLVFYACYRCNLLFAVYLLDAHMNLLFVVHWC